MGKKQVIVHEDISYEIVRVLDGKSEEEGKL